MAAVSVKRSIVFRAELLFYYVSYVLFFARSNKRYKGPLDFEKHKGLLGTF